MKELWPFDPTDMPFLNVSTSNRQAVSTVNAVQQPTSPVGIPNITAKPAWNHPSGEASGKI
jgi:hypothetical protein